MSENEGPALKIEESRSEDAILLRMIGRLAVDTLEIANEQLEAIPLNGRRQVMMDMAEIDQIDSRAIGALIGWHRRFGDRNMELRLVNLNDSVLRALQLSNLSNLLNIGPRPGSLSDMVRMQREALWESHEYAEQVLAAMGEGLIGLDDKCRILYVNPAAEEMLGRMESDLLGRHACHGTGLFASECDGDIKNCAIMRHLSDSDRTYRTEIWISGPEGQDPTPASLTARAIIDDDHLIGVVIGLVDISDRKRAEIANRDAARMEATSTLAAGIAHDFNNLMVGVLGNAELLKTDLSNFPAALDMLSEISRTARRAGELSQQLLAFSGGGKLESVYVDLRQCIERALAAIRPTFISHVRIRVRHDEDLRAVEGDPSQLTQVIKSLALNALEAVEDAGRVVIGVRNVELSAEAMPEEFDLDPGMFVEVSVEDEGHGMDEQTCARIFEPFYSTKTVGRGLGLSAAYGIIANHGGAIRVESHVDEGSKFMVYLPATEQMAQRASEPVPSEEVEAHGETVLVVDDEDLVRSVSQAILEREGYRVLLAGSGQEAVEIARSRQGKIQIVLLDMGMPVMGGAKTFDKLEEVCPDARVIICSGYALDHESQALLQRGARAFLSKPFDPKTLLSKVQEVLQPPND